MKANRPKTLLGAFLSLVVFFSTFGGTSADILAQDQVYTLTVSFSSMGPGSGTVTSDPPGINCGTPTENVCSYAFPANLLVRLYVQPAEGSLFSGWNGDCSGRSTCEVLMSNNRNVGVGYRTSNWYIRGMSDTIYGYTLFGDLGDIPVPADYNGDGKDDIAVFRDWASGWYVMNVGAFLFGGPGDIPVPADYNGDGKDDIAVFRPANGTWYIYGVGSLHFGAIGDLPVPADYNGDGKDDIAVFRPPNSTWYVYGVGNFLFGGPGDLPVPADYNGDGRDEIAVFRPSQSAWYIVGKDPFLFGGVGDIPVVADYNGDGRDDAAIFRGDVFGNPHVPWDTWYISGVGRFGFGLWNPEHIPVPADYNGDGKADIAFFWP